MKIACIQFEPGHGEIGYNLKKMRELIARADADCVIFPELALTGYFFKTRIEIAPLAEEIDGAIVRELSDIARTNNKAVITGFLETSGSEFFNSSLAFGSDGKLAGHYRKVHLFYYETQIFSRGDLGFPVFSLATRSETAKVGMLICYDWRFPEAARTLALKGAELIAMPSNIVTTTGMLHTTLQTRAFENKIVLAFCDRIGSEINGEEKLDFRGESAIIGMNGEVISIASSDDEEIIAGEVDLSNTRNKRINQFNDIFSDRPESGYGIK